MASREVTGASREELKQIKGKYYNSPQYLNHGIPFKTAYCLREITKQPDDYDGPRPRFCKRRAAKKDPNEYEGSEKDEAAFGIFCHTHGGNLSKVGHEHKDNLEPTETAAITHGAYAEDDNLIMDFTDEEQSLFDDIMHGWPEIYDWPAKDEDPARYRILRRVAVNEVRAMREEDYLDNHEIHNEKVFGENGVMGHRKSENPLSREYRLLMSEVTNQMKELGLTPKEQQRMDTMKSEEERNDAVANIAGDAIRSEDSDYDPSQFDND